MKKWFIMSEILLLSAIHKQFFFMWLTCNSLIKEGIHLWWLS